VAGPVWAGMALPVGKLVSRGSLETETFRFLAPEALFPLATIPGALLLALRSKADLSRTGFVLGTLFRALLAAALFVALARPTLRTDATLTSTVVLIDVSPSVSDASLERAGTPAAAPPAGRRQAGPATPPRETLPPTSFRPPGRLPRPAPRYSGPAKVSAPTNSDPEYSVPPDGSWS